MTTETELKGTFDQEDPEGYDYQDADSLLGRPIPSVSFLELGASVTGTILAVDVMDQREPNGQLKLFNNGDVRRQVVITLQTKQKDDAEDDGRRRLFVKGAMQRAFRAAMQAANVPGPRPGGKLQVTYKEDGEPMAAGLNPPKLYAVKYTAP